MSELFTIKALAADGQMKYRWQAKLLVNENDLYVLHGDWDRDLEHADGTKSPITNQSIEFYWTEQQFMIAALFDETGKLREFYGRVTSRPEIDANSCSISFALIGPDLQVQPDLAYEILSPGGDDSDEVSGDGWLDLIVLLERREGPFDRTVLSKYTQLAGLAK
jgi:protein associated with RNAse G/E